MFVFVLRVKDVLKTKGKDLNWLADQLSISRQSLYSRLKTGKIDTIEEIANIIGVPVHELIDCPKGYSHFYHEGEWHGIRKL